MLEQVTKKTLLFSIIFILLVSIVSVSILSLDNFAFAEEDEPEVDHEGIVAASNRSYDITHQDTTISCSNVYSTFMGCHFHIKDTAETVTIYGKNGSYTKNSKIIIEPRTTDLYIYFNNFSISGLDQETVIYNQSTEGTVHFVNIGTSVANIKGGNRRTVGSFEEGTGISGIFYTKGDVSFEGANGFSIHGGTCWGTTVGNLNFGPTAMQVVGIKNVTINTNVTITGGDGPNGIALGSLGYGGGHGGYAYDGALSRVIINGHLTLIGGKGGDGASVPSGGIVGLGGLGGYPYYLSINATPKSNLTTSNGAKGAKGRHTN
ncbi:MAG: hypothetical protein K5923_06935 [Clostridia bacterium]|nr:hypothetical protein [Clostridia bacterium]